MRSAALGAADRFAIEDLFSIYHWALDTGDVDGFADTFGDGLKTISGPALPLRAESLRRLRL